MRLNSVKRERNHSDSHVSISWILSMYGHFEDRQPCYRREMGLETLVEVMSRLVTGTKAIATSASGLHGYRGGGGLWDCLNLEFQGHTSTYPYATGVDLNLLLIT